MRIERISSGIMLIILLMALTLLGVSTPGQAEQIYKGDGTPGGLVPDFPQDVGQQVKGICGAAATADSLWYFDQHGYDGLVKHKDPAKPNDTWKEDAKALTLDLANRIYGKDYMENKPGSQRGGRGVEGALQDYLTGKGVYDSQKNDGTGLTVRYIEGAKATYDKWQSELAKGEDLIGRFTWRDKDGNPVKIKDPGDPKGKKDGEIVHAMTGVGWDTEKKKIKVSNPWGDHPADKPPDNKSYFSEYNINIGADGRVTIPKAAGVDLFGYDADHITLDGFWDVSPGEATKVKDSVKPSVTPKMNQYSYEVQNLSFDPIFQFALEVQVPFSLDTVTAPNGWFFAAWDPASTTDVTPAPSQLPEPGVPMDAGFSDWNPSIEGILWYTFNNPIASGLLLDGFSFEVSDIYPHGEHAVMAGLSDGLSRLIDSGTTGLVTEFAVTSGPQPVPEPGTILLMGSALAAFFLSQRKRFGS